MTGGREGEQAGRRGRKLRLRRRAAELGRGPDLVVVYRRATAHETWDLLNGEAPLSAPGWEPPGLSDSRQQKIGVRALARGAAAAASGRASKAEREAHRAHLGRPLQRERPPETAWPNIAEAEHRPLPRRKRSSGVAEAEHRRGRTSPFAAHEEDLEHRRGAAMRVARAAAVLRDEHELEQLEARIDHNVVVDLEVDATC